MQTPQVSIQFKTIELLSKSMLEREPEVRRSPPTDFHFDIVAESIINPTINTIFVKVTVAIKEKDKAESIASISIGCGFEIGNFDEIIKKTEGNNYLIPPELDTLIKSVAVSTSRGIIYSEFRGTYLYNVVLPIIIFQPPLIDSKGKKVEGFLEG